MATPNDQALGEMLATLKELAGSTSELAKQMRELRFAFGDVIDQGSSEKFPGYIRVRVTE